MALAVRLSSVAIVVLLVLLTGAVCQQPQLDDHRNVCSVLVPNSLATTVMVSGSGCWSCESPSAAPASSGAPSISMPVSAETLPQRRSLKLVVSGHHSSH